jgi:hypothetical protein
MVNSIIPPYANRHPPMVNSSIPEMQIGILTTMLSSGKSWSLQMPGLMPDHAIAPHLESIFAPLGVPTQAPSLRRAVLVRASTDAGIGAAAGLCGLRVLVHIFPFLR